MPRVMIEFRGSKYIHLRLVAPSERGVVSLINALKGAMLVEDDETYEDLPSVTLGDEVTVQVKQLRRETRYKVVVYDAPEGGGKPAPKKLHGRNGHKARELGDGGQLGLRLTRGGA